MIAKLILLYNSKVDPYGDFDLAEVKRLLEKVKAAGIACEFIDTHEMPQAEMEKWRERAWYVAIWNHVAIRQAFGSRRKGMLSLLGKEVPALFVYKEGDDKPVDIYPHKKGKEEQSILDYLKSLVQA